MIVQSKKKRNLLLILVNMIAAMVFFTPYMRFSYYDQMLAALNLNNQAFGMLAAVYGLVATFGFLISGALADRFSPKALLSISCLGMGICTIWHAMLPDYTSLLIIYGLFGIFSIVTFWSPYLKFIRSLGTEKEQGRLFGSSEALRGVTATIVAFGCLAILGQFADGAQGFRALLYLNAGIFMMLGILAIVFLPSVEKGHRKETVNLSMLKESIKNPGLWMITLLVFCGYGLATFGANYLGTYTTQILGLSENLGSSLAIIRIYVLCIIGGFLGGIIADKSKSRAFFISLLFILAIMAVILIIITSNIMATFAIVLTFILSFAYYTIKSLYFSTLGEGGIAFALTGISTGLISFLGFLPDVFVTPIVGAWLDNDPKAGFIKMFICMIVLGIVGAGTAIMIHRRSLKLKK